MYSELDKNEISTGFLYDKVISFSGLSKFNGKDSIYSSTYTIWEQAYFEMENSSVNENIIPSYNELYKKADELYKGKNIFPIAFIDIKYNKIKDNAIEDGLIIFKENKFYNVTDKTESPYLEKRAFLSAILTQKKLNYSENNFIIYEDFYISNDNNIKVDYFEINFDDGQGFKKYYFNEIIPVYYNNPGEKTIQIKTHYSDSTELHAILKT